MLEISSGRRLSISVQHLMAFGLENNWSKHIIPKSDGKVIEMKIAKDRKVIEYENEVCSRYRIGKGF